MKTGQKSSQKWYNQKSNAFVLALLAGCLVYIIALLAIDTGKLQFYFLGIVLLIFAINRLIVAVHPTKRNKNV